MRCRIPITAAVLLPGLLAIGSPASGAAPRIVLQPANQMVGIGETVRFSVVVEADGLVTYQWQFDETNLANATTSSLVLTNVQPSQAGPYSVLVSDGSTTVASDEAVLEVCWEVELASFQQISLNNPAYGSAAVFDRESNLYIVRFIGNESGFIVAKSTPAGEPRWETRFPVPTNAAYLRFSGLAVDSAGNVCLLGVAATHFYTDTESILLWKLDTNGAEVWNTSYESAGFPHGIAVDPAGNVYVTGSTSEGISSAGAGKPLGEIEVTKFSPSGQRLWTTAHDGPETAPGMPGALDVDRSGNSYVAGTTYEFGGELILIKYDEAGHRVWVARQASYERMYPPNWLQVDAADNLIVGLSFMHGDPVDTHETRKYDTEGNLLWTIGHQTASDIQATGARALDRFNNVYFAVIQPYDSDFVCTKYDSDGRFLWSVTRDADEEFTFGSYGLALHIDPQQEVLFAGPSLDGMMGVLRYRQNTRAGRPVIHGELPSQRVASGSEVALNLVVTGDTPLHYQWRRDGIPLPGGTNAMEVLSNLTLLDSGRYSLLVTNAAGCSVSAEGLLTVVDVQPLRFENLVVTPSNLTFRATGEAGRIYWFEASTNLADWTQLFGTGAGPEGRPLTIPTYGRGQTFLRARTDP